MVNFTEAQKQAKLQVEPILSHWNINANTNRSELSFIQNPATILLNASPPEPAKAVETAGELGSDMDVASKVMGIIASFSMALSVASGGAPSGPIINMIKLFKMFFR